MPFNVNTTTHNRLTARSTWPIYLVEWELTGAEELFSLCGVNVTYNGKSYPAASGEVRNITDNKTAEIAIPATADLLQIVTSGAWRGKKKCCVYNIAGDPDEDPIFEASEGLLQVDGVINNVGERGGFIIVSALHKNLSGNYTPRDNCSEFSIHIPPAGTLFTAGGQTYELKSRRN